MNKPLRRVAVFMGMLMVALMLRDNWLQFVRADELANDPHNPRVTIARYSHPRGDIITADGVTITGSTKSEGRLQYKRTYKNGKLWAPVTGFASQAYGAKHLEALYDDILSGQDDRLFFDRTLNMLTGEQQQGGNVVTTLNSEAQKAAFEGLGDKKGAVVALNPETGAVLALANKPSYDPSRIAGDGAKAQEAWTELTSDPDKPMKNRALRATYPPGSTFKVVTAAAALESGKYTLDGKTNTPVPYELPNTNTDLTNSSHDEQCKNASIRVAMKWSCNTVFAKISDKLGNEKMQEMARKFGYGMEKLDIPVRAAKSVYPDANRPQNAMAGIGQASNRATPLQMAMVAAAVANDGKLMKPYMVDKLQAPDLSTIEQTEPEELSQPVSGETAQKLQEAMETVVEEGTATNVQIPGYTIGGKTGTAQHGVNNSKNPYAWFISYAQLEDGSSPVAVAVVIEDSDTAREDISGSGLAGPIAKKVMKTVLENQR